MSQEDELSRPDTDVIDAKIERANELLDEVNELYDRADKLTNRADELMAEVNVMVSDDDA